MQVFSNISIQLIKAYLKTKDLSLDTKTEAVSSSDRVEQDLQA
jgi:hypothetical protein